MTRRQESSARNMKTAAGPTSTMEFTLYVVKVDR
jgi:hypothetical protein